MLLYRMVVDTERGRTGLPQCRVRVGVDSYNLKKVLNLTCLLTNLTTSRMFYHPRTQLSGGSPGMTSLSTNQRSVVESRSCCPGKSAWSKPQQIDPI
jgi:hypothetical protein